METPTSIQDLTKHYRDVITEFMSFSRHQNELHLKEIDETFRLTKSSRLLEGHYTQSEVLDVLDNLMEEVKRTAQRESQHAMYTNVELLRQVFAEVDMMGTKIKVDISSLEHEDAINAVRAYEKKTFAPKAAGGLPLSAKPLDIATLQELDDLKAENKQLAAKLEKVQTQFTTMMKEKTAMGTELRELKDQLEFYKKNSSESASTVGQELENKNKEIEELRKQVAALQESAQRYQQQAAQQQGEQQAAQSAKIAQLTKELEEAQKALAIQKTELASTKKEVETKVTDSAQFKSLKKMLANKNQQVKELREQLAKLGVKDTAATMTAAGGMAGDDSSDEEEDDEFDSDDDDE